MGIYRVYKVEGLKFRLLYESRCVYIHIYIYIYIYIKRNIHACIHIEAHECVHEPLCVCVLYFIYIYIYMLAPPP